MTKKAKPARAAPRRAPVKDEEREVCTARCTTTLKAGEHWHGVRGRGDPASACLETCIEDLPMYHLHRGELHEGESFVKLHDGTVVVRMVNPPKKEA